MLREAAQAYTAEESVLVKFRALASDWSHRGTMSSDEQKRAVAWLQEAKTHEQNAIQALERAVEALPERSVFVGQERMVTVSVEAE